MQIISLEAEHEDRLVPQIPIVFVVHELQMLVEIDANDLVILSHEGVLYFGDIEVRFNVDGVNGLVDDGLRVEDILFVRGELLHPAGALVASV